jgi:hypothetical protein
MIDVEQRLGDVSHRQASNVPFHWQLEPSGDGLHEGEAWIVDGR